MYKIVYFLEKKFRLNIQNWQHSSKKNVYIEYIEFYTLFEKIVYVEYTNYLHSLKLCTLDIQILVYSLKNCFH